MWSDYHNRFSLHPSSHTDKIKNKTFSLWWEFLASTLLCSSLILMFHNHKLIPWPLCWAYVPNFWCPTHPAQGPKQICQDTQFLTAKPCVATTSLSKYSSSLSFHGTTYLNIIDCFPYLIKHSFLRSYLSYYTIFNLFYSITIFNILLYINVSSLSSSWATSEQVFFFF